MSGDLSLFGDDEPATPTSRPDNSVVSLPTWQVQALRQALDAAGLADLSSRQERVETIVGRSVTSLHELSTAEAAIVRDQLARTERPTRSAWDDRDEDTWIDKL